MKVKDRIAIVTGAGRGIGRGIAEALAREGASVMLVARHEQETSEVADYIKTHKGKAEYIAGDISVIEDMNKAVEATLNTFGRIDILVNCAATAPAVGPSETLPLAEWERVIKTDLTGTFIACQAVGWVMLNQKYGRIVNIASIHALATYPQRAAYAAAKAGVCGLTRVLAIEWAGQGITVNTVAPGTIKTPRTSWFIENDPASEEAILRRTPAGRLGEPGDVAAAVLFLASEEAGFVNGQTIVVDGGWTASAWWGKYTEE
ncbi:SDR family NAD(P)-dependent oxidoreductase [Chloroflexota bacterium]